MKPMSLDLLLLQEQLKNLPAQIEWEAGGQDRGPIRCSAGARTPQTNEKHSSHVFGKEGYFIVSDGGKFFTEAAAAPADRSVK